MVSGGRPAEFSSGHPSAPAVGRISSSAAGRGSHAGTARKTEEGGPLHGAWWHSSSRGYRRTESLNGRASYAHEAEGEPQYVRNRVVVRSSSDRRLTCSLGAQRGYVVR